MPIHHLIPAGVRNLLSTQLSRALPAIGTLAAGASLTGCSLFASAGGGTDTDTVPLPKRGDSTSYDWPDESDLIVDDGQDTSADPRPGLGWASGVTGDPPVNPHLNTASSNVGASEKPKTNDPAPKTDTRHRNSGYAAAWSAPRTKNPIRLETDPLLAPTKPDTGSVLEVPVPNSPIVEPEESRPLLPLSEFRKRVFAIQQKEEANRFRDAIKSPKRTDEQGDETAASSPNNAEKSEGKVEGISAPRAELVAEDEPVSPDSPRVKAAYQIYRWNLMETLAGAERAYWSLHFTDQQFAELEQSLGHLAGINDKARIGLLRKTRSKSDILATETMLNHRKISVAEADAKRTSAMSELASYYTAYSSDGSSATSRPTRLIRTESPAKINPSTDAAALMGRADKVHPLYIGARLRDGDPEPQPDAAPSAHIKERVDSSLDRLRTARETVGKTRSQIEIFSAAYDENLRNFGNGKIDLPGITTFEKSYLTARQKHLEALLDYQNSLIDLELEVGDFLENRGQEIPLSDLLKE